jgi:hypothetical protein
MLGCIEIEKEQWEMQGNSYWPLNGPSFFDSLKFSDVGFSTHRLSKKSRLEAHRGCRPNPGVALDRFWIRKSVQAGLASVPEIPVQRDAQAEAEVKAVIEKTHGVRLQVSFGNETALI